MHVLMLFKVVEKLLWQGHESLANFGVGLCVANGLFVFFFLFCFAGLNIVAIEWWFQEQISEGKLAMVLKFNPKSTITIALKFISPRSRRGTRSSALEIS